MLSSTFIDDLGYVQQSREEMEVLFTLLAERYERGSVLISSNLPFSKWDGIFKDPMTTAAAIDRLVHHSVILELNLPSYRMERARGRDQAAPAEGPAEYRRATQRPDSLPEERRGRARPRQWEDPAAKHRQYRAARRERTV